MTRSALMDWVKDDRKDSLKMIESHRLRKHLIKPAPAHAHSKEIFKQFILSAEPYNTDYSLN